MLDPIVGTILSVSFGLMLLMASVHKLGEFALFRAVLADYRVMPRRIVPLAAAVLPIIEFGLGLAWLFADNIAIPAIATSVLLSLYTAAVALNLVRGRVHISCGCGFGKSTDADDALSWGLVIRNLLLLAATCLAMLPVGAREVGLLDYFTLMAALLVVVLLFAAGNQLSRNLAAVRSWRSPVTSDD